MRSEGLLLPRKKIKISGGTGGEMRLIRACAWVCLGISIGLIGAFLWQHDRSGIGGAILCAGVSLIFAITAEHYEAQE
jgi:hypothetical protein